MPLLTAITTFSVVIWKCCGQWCSEKYQNKAGKRQYMKQYQEEFIQFFPTVLSILMNRRTSHPRVKIAYDHLEECVKYNVVGGKMTRGLMVVSTLSQLYGDGTLSDREKHLAFTLGWCIEILQAASLVADDIVDESLMRRNKLCWYKQDHIRMTAVNDSFWLISSAYVLLNSEFRHHPCYIELIELFHMIVEYTKFGEIVDIIFSQKNNDLSQFTEERLKSIVKYKTGYFSFYFPVAAAFCMAGIKDKAADDGALSILLAIGEYYQYQDDFIDCYGDPKIIGKVGTDIQGNKCTWLIVQALKRASDEQRAILEANYGRSDEGCVEKVKEVYESLNLRHLYSEYEEQSYHTISKLIDEHSHILPAPIFLELRDRIYKREK
ncbi:farnesyl pyrophosphate synthase-like [Dysidea avara]|uniref:farnesyl pyrophosphate synthase-like n=1 Tax=Dysidea avara TaxID=196820 RepID=UPI00331F94D8